MIEAGRAQSTRRLLFLGSSFIYPKMVPQMMTEDALLTGCVNPTCESHLIAKMAGERLRQENRCVYRLNFICAIRAKLYGHRSSLVLKANRALLALLRKVREANIGGKPSMEIWERDRPQREFLDFDGVADASSFLLRNYTDELDMNVGSGGGPTIRNVTQIVTEVVGVRDRIIHDPSRSDAAPLELVNAERLRARGPTNDLQSGFAANGRTFRKTARTCQ